MRFEKVKKVLKNKAARVVCAGMIMAGAAAAVMPNSYAAVLGIDMAAEVGMYDPSDGSFFFVENRTVADECTKKYGWVQVTNESVDTGVVIPITTRLTAEQAMYKAKFVYMYCGATESQAIARVNKLADRYTNSPDRWWEIAGADCCSNPFKQSTDDWMWVTKAKVEQLEQQLTGTVLYSTGTTASASTKYSSAEEEVNQLYASLVANGKTSDQAMAEVNAQLATIIAKYAK